MSSKKSSYNNGVGLLLEGNTNLLRVYNEFSLLATNRFKWSNLPPGMESRHIENGLFKKGQVMFFYDENKGGYLCLPCNPINAMNVYGDTYEFDVYGVSYNKRVNTDQGVRILSNDNAYGDHHQVMYYSNMIEELEKTYYMNLKQQRLPYVVATTKQNELTMKNVMKKVFDGEESIFIDEKMSIGGDVGINVLKTDSKYLLHDLQQSKNDIMNELYTFLGINNKSNDKKERLLVDEVNVNNGQILMSLDKAFKNRQLACDLINEKFGLNIKVEKVIDKLSTDFVGQIQEPKEGDKNE